MGKSQLVDYRFLVMPTARGRGGLTEYLASALRQAIVTLQLEPGMPIDKQEICTRLGVSRWPVSEALVQLQHEGLVEVLPQRGSLVSRIRLSDILDYMLIRRALESEAAALCAVMNSRSRIETLTDDLKAMRRAIRAKDAEGFETTAAEFHQHLAGSLDLPRLGAAIEGARGNLERARRLLKQRVPSARAVKAYAQIVEAIVEGDAAGAATAMRGHLDTLILEIMRFARTNPSQFTDRVEETAQRFPVLFPIGVPVGAPANRNREPESA